MFGVARPATVIRLLKCSRWWARSGQCPAGEILLYARAVLHVEHAVARLQTDVVGVHEELARTGMVEDEKLVVGAGLARVGLERSVQIEVAAKACDIHAIEFRLVERVAQHDEAFRRWSRRCGYSRGRRLCGCWPLNRVYHGGPCRSFTCRKGKKRDYEYESARLHLRSIC